MKKKERKRAPGFHLEWEKILSRALREARKTVVLGVGNPDRGDDGAGPLCAESLKKRIGTCGGSRLLVLDGRAVPESRTGEIRRFAPDLTVIVDAAAAGLAPGTIFVLDADALSDEGVSTHTISLFYLARYLEKSIGSRVLILGIEPSRRIDGAGISAPVSRAAKDLSAAMEARFFPRALRKNPCR